MGISRRLQKQVGFSPSNSCLLGTSCQQQTKASFPPLPGLPSSCKQGGNFKGENRSLLFRRRAVMPVTVSCHPLGDPGQPKPHQRDFCFFTAQRWPLAACRDVSVSSGVPVPAASHAPFPSTQALAIALSGAAGCGEN